VTQSILKVQVMHKPPFPECLDPRSPNLIVPRIGGFLFELQAYFAPGMSRFENLRHHRLHSPLDLARDSALMRALLCPMYRRASYTITTLTLRNYSLLHGEWR